MNPGVGEEVGKTARGFIDSMKEQPLALALCLMNAGLLVLFYMIMDRVSDTRLREMGLMYEEQKEVRQLLSNCVVQKQTFQLQSETSKPFVLLPLTKQGQPDSELKVLSLQKPGATEQLLPDLPSLTKP